MATPDNYASREAGEAMPATPPRENLYRINPDIGLTRSADGGMPTMTGHFAVWDQWTEIRSAYEGNFMERFAPGAMTRTLSQTTPKVLFQHGKDPQIGDKVLGIPTRVEPDQEGAFCEVPLFDTGYNRDLVPGLDAGAYGMSFRFSVMQEDVDKRPKRSDFNPRGIPERTVTEAKVMEFGPVTFPAYAGTSVGLRSITDDFLMEQFIADEEVLERLAARIAEKAPAFTVSFSGAGFTTTSSSANAVVKISEPDGAPENRADVPEPEPSEVDAPTDTTASDSEPSVATTRDDRASDPEPSEATTRSRTDLFWFVEPPEHLKGAK